MGFPAYQPAPSLPKQAPIDLAPLQKLLAAAPNRQGLAKTAAAQASQQVGAQLSAIQAAQQGELQQAAGRAREINAASLAGSHYLDSLGFAERLRAALQQAGQDQATFAQGFSGDLRHTAEQDAAKVQQSLAAIGAPGSVPNADALANTVYGLGRIPADVLTASAPLMYAQAQTLPASLLAAGREQAVGALGAGQQAAAQYRPQIAAAIGSLPKLTQGILSDLTAAAEKARQDAIGNMFAAVKLQQDGRTEEATQAWRNAQIQGDQWKTYTAAYNHWADAKNTAAYRTAELNKPHLFEAGGAEFSLDAKGNVTQITNAPPKTISSGGGIWQVGPDGTVTTLREPTVTSNKPFTSGGGIYRANPDGSLTTLKEPPASATEPKAPTTIGSSGHYQAWNPKTRQFEYLPGNKPPAKSPSGYQIPAGVLDRAAKVAELAFNGGKALTLGGESASIGGSRRPYPVALRQVEAALRAGSVPRKMAAAKAAEILLSVGYPPPPKPGKPGFFDNAQAFVGAQLPG